MIATTLVPIALAAGLGARPAQEPSHDAASTLTARAKALTQELALLGCALETPQEISVEPAGEYATALQLEVERLHGAGWIESQRYLRESLGIAPGRSLAEARVQLAQPFVTAYPAFFDAESRAVVADASRASELSDAQLLRAIVSAHRRSRATGEGLFRAPDRTVDSVVRDRALLAGEAELAALSLSAARAKREIKTLAVGSLENPLERGAGDELTRSIHGAGRDFALQHLQSGGWASIAAAYEAKPASCEQLAHANKLGKDVPKRDRLAAWDAALEVELLRRDELGELALAALLVDAGVPAAEAQLAALGWDGDELQWLRAKDGSHALVWRLYFDHHNDIRQFAEVFAPRVLGQVVVRGAVVDWVRAESVVLSQQLLAALPASKPNTASDPGDRASTEELERGVQGALDARPRLEGGRWVHARLGLSIPAPERWTMEFVNGQAFLMGPQVGKFRDNVAVVEFGLMRGATIDDLLEQQAQLVRAETGMHLELAEKRTLDKREVGFLRYTSQLDSGPVNCSSVLYLYDGRPVVVTMTVASAGLGRMQRVIDETIAGVRFIAPRKSSTGSSR